MKEGFKQILKILSIPLSLMGVFLIVLLLWNLLNLPKDERLIEITKNWFNHYGLWIVFISAILEGTLILGQYYPGGLVIFLGVISAGNNIWQVITVVSIVSLAFVFGYTIDYLIGKYGWYKLFIKFGLQKPLETAQMKLQKHALSAIMFSYWEPNLASVTATAAGILQLPLKKFTLYSVIGIVIWNSLWGTLVAALGTNALKIIGLKWVLIIFFVWVIVLLIEHFFFDRKKQLINIP